MELLCPPSNINITEPKIDNYIDADINSGNVTFYLSYDNVTRNLTKETESDTGWEYRDYVIKVAVPVLCAFGIIGNVLNIIILSTRIREGKQM